MRGCHWTRDPRDGSWTWPVGGYVAQPFHGNRQCWTLHRVTYEPKRTLTEVTNPPRNSPYFLTLRDAKARARELFDAEHGGRGL